MINPVGVPTSPLSALNQIIFRLWPLALGGFFSLMVVPPWLAPVFAKLGWWDAANAIYTVWIAFCHQLPERAGRLFGYEAATCWRCTALYGTMALGGLLFGVLRPPPQGGRGWRGISVPLFLLSSLPILLDGLSHGFGLRADNSWFTGLTGGVFGTVSVGNSLGTLNWWLRVLTGILFGGGVVLFVYPRVDQMLTRDLLGSGKSRLPLATYDRT